MLNLYRVIFFQNKYFVKLPVVFILFIVFLILSYKYDSALLYDGWSMALHSHAWCSFCVRAVLCGTVYKGKLK